MPGGLTLGFAMHNSNVMVYSALPLIDTIHIFLASKKIMRWFRQPSLFSIKFGLWSARKRLAGHRSTCLLTQSLYSGLWNRNSLTNSTTRRCMDSVSRPRQQRSQRTSLIALKQPRPGCDQTGFNPIQTRQSSCGVRPSGDNIDCQRHRCWSTAAPSLRSSLLATSASTSTATCRCGRMFNVPCRVALLRCVRSVALYRRPHYRC